MTHDPHRQWPKPLEEYARALCNRRKPQPVGGMDAWDNLATWVKAGDESARMEREAFIWDAQAVIGVNIARGWANPQFFEAQKAELNANNETGEGNGQAE